jgi:hypothetical protein
MPPYAPLVELKWVIANLLGYSRLVLADSARNTIFKSL